MSTGFRELPHQSRPDVGRLILGIAEERCRLHPDRVQDGEHVVHLLFHWRQLECPVRQPRTASVQDDQPREGSQTVEEARELGLFPLVFDMGELARDEHQVDRAVTDHLVRDVN